MNVHQHNLRMERIQHRIFWLSAALLIGLGLAIWGTLAVGAAQFVLHHGLNRTLLGVDYNPTRGQFGLLPFFMGSVSVTMLALALAYPLSLSVAAVTVLMGKRAWLAPVRQGMGALVAIPSVIFGWWGLSAVVPLIRQVSGSSGFSLLAAGLVLALMILPTLSLLTINAFARVPERWIDGSLALGATPDQTLGRLVLRSVKAPLIEAGIVAVGRALGETMAVQMVIGGQTLLPHGLLSPAATLTTELLSDISLLPPGVEGHHVLDFMALSLLLIMYGLVLLVERIRGRAEV